MRFVYCCCLGIWSHKIKRQEGRYHASLRGGELEVLKVLRVDKRQSNGSNNGLIVAVMLHDFMQNDAFLLLDLGQVLHLQQLLAKLNKVVVDCN